jgi:peptide-methionine (S)-S-oxide reductase
MKDFTGILAIVALAIGGSVAVGGSMKKTETATVGGGCFWCVEAAYEGLEGIESVVSGYAGGSKQNPTYRQVCDGNTGHAEVVQITYDPAILSYADVLDRFWLVHDPTTLDRQGADVGTQYRSVILYESEDQRAIAERSLTEAQKGFSSKIVTEIKPLKKFYPAEEYHQDYFAKNPNAAYCTFVIKPKLEKLKKHDSSRKAAGSVN